MDLNVEKMLTAAITDAQKSIVSPYITTATVTSISGDTIFVRIPGSDNPTPIKASSVAVSVGDIVDLSVSHSDTHITGNRTDKAATSTVASNISKKHAEEVKDFAAGEAEEASKVATNYMNFDNNGLTVGNMTANILGNNVLIDSNSVDIRDGESILASYGSDIVLYNDNKEAFSIKKSSLIAKAMDPSDTTVGYLKTTKTLEILKGQSFKTQKEKTSINCDCDIDLTVNCPNFIVWHIQWIPQYSSDFGYMENLSDIDKNDYIFIQLNGFVTGG